MSDYVRRIQNKHIQNHYLGKGISNEISHLRLKIQKMLNIIQ